MMLARLLVALVAAPCRSRRRRTAPKDRHSPGSLEQAAWLRGGLGVQVAPYGFGET